MEGVGGPTGGGCVVDLIERVDVESGGESVGRRRYESGNAALMLITFFRRGDWWARVF
jgi:hypothetical protein